MTVGYPRPDLYNIDPSTRLQTLSTGCIVSGGQFLWQIPNNLTLRLLTWVLGPMRGTYRGPYPSADDLASALRTAQPATSTDLERDVVTVDGQRIRLRKGLGRELASALDRNQRQVVGAALWHYSVLVLEFTAHPSYDGEDGLPQAAALIDVTSGKVIAYYDPRGALGRFPMQWT